MDTPPAVTSSVNGDALNWAFRRLAAAFPASFPDDPDNDAVIEKALLWRDLLDDNPWITAGELDVQQGIWVTHGVFDLGVRTIALTHPGDFIPAPKVALDYFHQAKAKRERLWEQQRAALALKALPPPDDPNALTPQEVADVLWIRNWYARTLAMRQDAAWLDDRLDPETLAFQRECERYEDVIGHLPDLPPEQLKAALRSYRASPRQPIQETTPP